MCPNSMYFLRKGMALPKAGFGSLCFILGLDDSKGSQIVPHYRPRRTSRPPILTHYRLRTKRVQSEWKCFTSPCRGFHPTRVGYQLPLSFLWPGLLPHGVNVCKVFQISGCVRGDKKHFKYFKTDIPQFIKINKEDHIYKYYKHNKMHAT